MTRKAILKAIKGLRPRYRTRPLGRLMGIVVTREAPRSWNISQISEIIRGYEILKGVKENVALLT